LPQKTAKYRLAPEAKRDLESIWLYTLEEWGLEQANRYIDDFTSAFALLADNPNGIYERYFRLKLRGV